MKRLTGFTLVEMMITLAILAILIALAVPSLNKFIQNSRIRTAAESFQAGLHLARNESLRRNARVSLWMVTNLSAACARGAAANSWIVSIDDPTGSCNSAPSDSDAPRLIQVRSGNEGSETVQVAATGGTCITFNGFGGVEAVCTGGDAPMSQIDFTSGADGTRALRIEISPGGAAGIINRP